jgi:hypothetical protein
MPLCQLTKSIVVMLALSLNPSGLRHRPPAPQDAHPIPRPARPRVIQRYAGVLPLKAPEIAGETAYVGLRC